MEAAAHGTGGEPIEALRDVLDRLANDEPWRADDDRLLARIDQLAIMITRLGGIRLRLVHEADRRRVCEDRHGWSLANRLVAGEPQPLRRARATVALSHDLHRFAAVHRAVCDGSVSLGQAGAIVQALHDGAGGS